MADPTLGERLVDFFSGHQSEMFKLNRRLDEMVDLLIDIKSRAQSADITLMKRITEMDANVAALAAAVSTLQTSVGSALAQVGKLSPADESTLAGAVSNLNALSAEVSAVLNPAGVTGATGPAAPAEAAHPAA